MPGKEQIPYQKAKKKKKNDSVTQNSLDSMLFLTTCKWEIPRGVLFAVIIIEYKYSENLGAISNVSLRSKEKLVIFWYIWNLVKGKKFILDRLLGILECKFF